MVFNGGKGSGLQADAMSFFDDIIKSGLSAAESAWGSTFTLDGSGGTYTGTFDRHQDSSAPSDGGYLDQISAVIVCNRLQFDILLGIATEQGDQIVTESQAALMIENDDTVFPQIGQKLTHDSRKYLITSREIDASSITLGLRSINR